jgi:hypothetical protein
MSTEEGPAALALINERYALAELSLAEVELRRMALANDALDRTGERFSEAFLRKLAATLPGKPVLAHHDKGSFPLGRFYAAQVEEDPGTGVLWLIARWYLLKSVENESLRRHLDAGIYAHVSIGFRGGELMCDVCSEPFWGDCPHWPGQEVTREGRPVPVTMTWQDPRGTAEAVEGSLVWLGAQRGARVIKEAGVAGRQGERATGPPGAAKRPTPQARGRGCDEEGGREAMEEAAERERLDALAADGRLYREELIAEIQRLAGLVDASMEADVLCRALAGDGAARLRALRDEYQKRVDLEFPPAGTGLPAESAHPAEPTRWPRAHTLV